MTDRAMARIPHPHGWDEMNKLEQYWSALLNLDKNVRRWVFEGTKLRLSKGTYYTPDFTVFKKNGLIEMHECKGFMREAARVRLFTAAELYPEYRFVLIRKEKNVWKVEVVLSGGGYAPSRE